MGECDSCESGGEGFFLLEHLRGGVEVVGTEDTRSA